MIAFVRVASLIGWFATSVLARLVCHGRVPTREAPRPVGAEAARLRAMAPVRVPVAAGRRARRVLAIALPVALVASPPLPANAQGGTRDGFARITGVVAMEPTLLVHDWRAFQERFVTPDGRVVDHERYGVTHSDAQGYGLLLAAAAGDRATFESIATFTLDRMRTRADGLISWLYNPRAFPPVVDVNNASAGDVLIAKALIKAAIKWNEPRYLEAAVPMVDAIGRNLLHRMHGLVVLRPAAFGFDAGHHSDGPLVNLSYYVFGAFRLFALVNDEHPWQEAWESGLKLSDFASRRPGGLPPDWASLATQTYLLPARGYPRRSSYNAVRIPLHMALGGGVPSSHFAPFDQAWNIEGDGTPVELDLIQGRPVRPLDKVGYRAVAALAACAARGVPFPEELLEYRNSTYYASTMHLLTLSAIRANYPHCLTRERQAVRLAVPDGAPRFTVRLDD